MAINKINATMQMRRGNEQDFDPNQMTAGEWAVSLDSKKVWMCFAPGLVRRMATYEAFEEDMTEIQTILATCQDIQEAVEAFERLAKQHKNASEDYSKLSKSYAVGTGGEIREGDEIDNAKEYARRAKESAERASEIAGGNFILQSEKGVASGVASLDSDGKVPKIQLPSLKAEDIGALPVDGDAKNTTVTFASGDSVNPTGWADVDAVTSGEKLSSLMRKFSLFAKNARYLWKLMGNTSLTGIGDGTVTGAINALNTGMPFGGRTYATYNPETPRLAKKHITLPEEFKQKDTNNFFVAVEIESENDAAQAVHFVHKNTGAFNVYFRRNSGADWDTNVAVWFSYIVVIGH